MPRSKPAELPPTLPLLLAAVAEYNRLLHEAEREARIEREMIAQCVADHSTMPTNHWHQRYRAEEKMRAARRLVEAFAAPSP